MQFRRRRRVRIRFRQAAAGRQRSRQGAAVVATQATGFASLDANNDGDLLDAGDWQYEYDGLGRRVSKWQDTQTEGSGQPDTTPDADEGNGEEFYYNDAWQNVEVRAATTTASLKTIDPDPKERVLWDLTYIDAPAMVELDTNTDGTRDQRLWPTWDANYNVTALLTDSGMTVERYSYTPYGQQIVINGDQNYANSNADPDGAEWTADTNGSDSTLPLAGSKGCGSIPRAAIGSSATATPRPCCSSRSATRSSMPVGRRTCTGS